MEQKHFSAGAGPRPAPASIDLAPPLLKPIASDTLAENYLRPRSISLDDWTRCGGEIISAAEATKNLGLHASPLPSATIALWMPGENGYGAAIYLSLDAVTGELFRDRRAPSKYAAEHDVIRIGWRDDAKEIYDAESVVKAIAIHAATGLPVIANSGIRGWANTHFHKSRKHGDGTVREYILYDSLLPDNADYARKRLDQREAERLRCELSIEQGFIPYVIRLPEPPKVTGLMQWGADDYLAYYGRDALVPLKRRAIRYTPPPTPTAFDADVALGLVNK